MPEITEHTKWRTETETHRMVFDGATMTIYARRGQFGEKEIRTPGEARELAAALEAMAKLMEEKRA